MNPFGQRVPRFATRSHGDSGTLAGHVSTYPLQPADPPFFFLHDSKTVHVHFRQDRHHMGVCFHRPIVHPPPSFAPRHRLPLLLLDLHHHALPLPLPPRRVFDALRPYATGESADKKTVAPIASTPRSQERAATQTPDAREALPAALGCIKRNRVARFFFSS